MKRHYSYPLKTLAAIAISLWICVHSFAQEGSGELERPGKLFSPSKIPLLEDAGRDTWQKPDEILHALNIKEGDVVADVGAGSGYLTEKLSVRVGQGGTVYAVEVQQEMLDFINKRIEKNNLKNVVSVRGNMNDPKLQPGSIDVAILLSVYHEIEHPVDFMKRIKPALKPHGKLVIIEFSSKSPIGPPLKVRLPEELVIKELHSSGFTLLQTHTILLPYQYFLIFIPS